MTGLRATKKERTRASIVDAAYGLIRSQGFNATTMEQIAVEATVSTGTLYNYFPSKHALLLAVWSGRATQALASVDHRIDTVGTAAGKCAELLVLFAEVVSLFETSVMREVLASALTSPNLDLEGYVAIDLALIGRLETLIADLQDAGDVAADIDPGPAATLLYAATMMQVIGALAAPRHFDLALTREAITAQVWLAFRGLAA